MDIRQSQIDQAKNVAECSVTMKGHPTKQTILNLRDIEPQTRNESVDCPYPANETQLKENILWHVQHAGIDKADVTRVDWTDDGNVPKDIVAISFTNRSIREICLGEGSYFFLLWIEYISFGG